MESLRNRILTLNEAINTYNNQPSTNSQYMSAHQALCFARNIEAATAEMNTYAAQLEKRDFLEVFSCDVFKTLRESSWLKGMRLETELNTIESTPLADFEIAEETDGHCTKTGSDLRRWIDERISAFNAAVKKVKKLTANLPPACFAAVYEKQSATVDIEPVQDAYDDWKLGVGKLTFKKLRNYRTKVVADFINLGLLRFATNPVLEEIDEVNFERIKRELEFDYVFGPNFKRDCATFRKMMGWKGNILVIDKENYGKYVCMYASKMKPEDLLEFFKLEKLLKLIHEDMAHVMPEMMENKPDDALNSDNALKYWKRLEEQDFVDKNHQLLPETSRQQAMYIAEVFALKLHMKNKWKSFEVLWGISNLAQEKWAFQQNGIMPPRYHEIDAIFEG